MIKKAVVNNRWEDDSGNPKGPPPPPLPPRPTDPKRAAGGLLLASQEHKNRCLSLLPKSRDDYLETLPWHSDICTAPKIPLSWGLSSFFQAMGEVLHLHGPLSSAQWGWRISPSVKWAMFSVTDMILLWKWLLHTHGGHLKLWVLYGSLVPQREALENTQEASLERRICENTFHAERPIRLMAHEYFLRETHTLCSLGTDWHSVCLTSLEFPSQVTNDPLSRHGVASTHRIHYYHF